MGVIQMIKKSVFSYTLFNLLVLVCYFTVFITLAVVEFKEQVKDDDAGAIVLTIVMTFGFMFFIMIFKILIDLFTCYWGIVSLIFIAIVLLVGNLIIYGFSSSKPKKKIQNINKGS